MGEAGRPRRRRLGVSPQVAIDPQGNATAIWPANNGTNTIVQAATRPAGGTWATPVELSANAVNPQVAIDARGNVIAVWDHYDGSNFNTAVPIVQAAVRPPAGRGRRRSTSPARYAVDPQVAVDAQGDATAVWDRYEGINETNDSAHRADGGAPGRCSVADAGRSIGHQHARTVPRVAVNARGDTIAAWDLAEEAHYFYHTAQSAVRPAGGAWQAPVALAATGIGYEVPIVALDEQGNATAALASLPWRVHRPASGGL